MLDQNYDRWKSASPPENDVVSPCCGDEYEDTVDDEGYEVFTCHSCDHTFDEPISEWEFNERMKENWADMKMDEERLEIDRDEH